MANNEIRKLGWKAKISDQIGGNWLKFSSGNTQSRFPGCNVSVTDYLLTVIPTGSTYQEIINVGDILFNYTDNTSETSERKATVTLIQNESNITHVYTFTQIKDELVSVDYTDFSCKYWYHFEETPSTSIKIEGNGGIINIYSIITQFEIIYKYVRNYLSNRAADSNSTWFKYVEIGNRRNLYSGNSAGDITDMVFNYDDYLEGVTRILKRKFPKYFFGFSKEQYENEFTYSAQTQSNIVVSPKSQKGQEFDVTVGRNPLEDAERTISISGYPFSAETVVSAKTDSIYDGNVFTYTQKSGYTPDNRTFSLSVTDNGVEYSAITQNSNMFFVADGNKVYIGKNEYGDTIISGTPIDIRGTYWTQYDYDAGERKYPDINEDTVLQWTDPNDTGNTEIYPISYSGSVCVRDVSAWVSTACSGLQENCQLVDGLEVIYKGVDPNSPTVNNKEEKCYCGASGGVISDITYVFEAVERGDDYEEQINSLNFDNVGDQKIIYINSYSACSGENSSWCIYETTETKPCTNRPSNPECPCELKDNSITGVSYSYIISFEFEYDYKKLAGKIIRFNLSGSSIENEKFAEFFIPLNYEGSVIQQEAGLSPLSDCYVDMGSGVLWAVKNIGAEKPEDYGSYFSWGNIEGHAEGTYVFSQSNYEKTRGWEQHGNITGDTLGDKFDAAHANLGGKWRLPTNDEFANLFRGDINIISNETKGGVRGVRVIHISTWKSIFFPYAGYIQDNNNINKNSETCLWENKDIGGNKAGAAKMQYGASPTANDQKLRYLGLPVRGVMTKP